MRVAVRYRRSDHQNGEFVFEGFDRLSPDDRERALEHALSNAGADPADLTFLERQPSSTEHCRDLDLIYLRDNFPYHTLDSCTEPPSPRNYSPTPEYISSEGVALISPYSSVRARYGLAIAQVFSLRHRELTSDITYWRRGFPRTTSSVAGHPLFQGNNYQVVLPLTTLSGDYEATFTIRAGDSIILGGQFAFHVNPSETLNVFHREEYTQRLNRALVFHLLSSRRARATIHFVYQTNPYNSFSTNPRPIQINEGEFRYVVPMNNRIPSGHSYAIIRFEDGTVVSVRC